MDELNRPKVNDLQKPERDFSTDPLGLLYGTAPMVSGQFSAMCELALKVSSGKGFWDQGNDGEMLMLIVSELSEALEALRAGSVSSWSFAQLSKLIPQMANDEVTALKEFEEVYKESFECEIADAFIRLFDLCAGLKISHRVGMCIAAKMLYNNQRPVKHGKKF